MRLLPSSLHPRRRGLASLLSMIFLVLFVTMALAYFAISDLNLAGRTVSTAGSDVFVPGIAMPRGSFFC